MMINLLNMMIFHSYVEESEAKYVSTPNMVTVRFKKKCVCNMFYRVDFTLNFLYLAGKTEFDKSWQ